MTMRILMDPTPSDGGGNGAPAPQPAPDFARPPAAAPEARGGDPPAKAEAARPEPTPPSPWESERKRYEAELGELRQFRASVEAEKERAERERLAKAGQFEEVETRLKAEIDREREARRADQKRYADKLVDLELTTALAEYPWVDGALDVARDRLRANLEAVDRDGTYEIRSKDFKAVRDYVREAIAGDPLYKHLIRTDGARPGSGATNPAYAPAAAHGADLDDARDNPILNARRSLQRAGRITPGGGFRIA